MATKRKSFVWFLLRPSGHFELFVFDFHSSLLFVHYIEFQLRLFVLKLSQIVFILKLCCSILLVLQISLISFDVLLKLFIFSSHLIVLLRQFFKVYFLFVIRLVVLFHQPLLLNLVQLLLVSQLLDLKFLVDDLFQLLDVADVGL